MLTSERRKVRDREKNRIKTSILNNLPVLNKRQIRRHRIAYYEALILELLEDNFEESAYFLKGLIDYQNEVYRKAGDEALAWNKPVLKKDCAMLDILYERLKEAETCLINSKRDEEITKLLELALFFTKQIDAWWWIAEQLFMLAIYSVKDYTLDGNKMQAQSHYIFGKFLLKQLEDIDRSNFNLKISRKLSIGENWEAIDTEKKKLYQECCSLLCDSYLITTQIKLEKDPALALKFAILAHKRANEGEYTKGKIDSIYYEGLCNLLLKKPNIALHKLNKALMQYYSTNNQTGICNTRLKLALAHKMLDNISEAKYQLRNLLQYTEKNNLTRFNALCHRQFGELYLVNNIGQEAYIHLMKAFQIYHKLDDIKNSELTKSLASIATGSQLIKKFLTLITKCGEKESNIKYVLKLVYYKDDRRPFWDEDNLSDELSYLKHYLEIYGEYMAEDDIIESNLNDTKEIKFDLDLCSSPNQNTNDTM